MELIQLPFPRFTFASVLSTSDTVVWLYSCLQNVFFITVKIDLVLRWADIED